MCVMFLGLCPLHLAVRVNSLSCVRALLELRADAEVQELTCGRTALHLAIEMDNLSLSGCLLLEVLLRISVLNSLLAVFNVVILNVP